MRHICAEILAWCIGKKKVDYKLTFNRSLVKDNSDCICVCALFRYHIKIFNVNLHFLLFFFFSSTLVVCKRQDLLAARCVTLNHIRTIFNIPQLHIAQHEIEILLTLHKIGISNTHTHIIHRGLQRECFDNFIDNCNPIASRIALCVRMCSY